MAKKNICCIFILLTFSLVPSSYFSQYKSTASISNLSKEEKRWAVFHPFCALKVRRITKTSLKEVERIKKTAQLDQYDNGGKLDAFRHVYTMALLAQKIKTSKLRKLGIAHEKGNYRQYKKGLNENGERPDSLSCVMDLFNNDIGLETGKRNKSISADSLSIIVVKLINAGESYYFKRNTTGDYLDCNGQIIDPANWKGKWYIPKCFEQIKTN